MTSASLSVNTVASTVLESLDSFFEQHRNYPKALPLRAKCRGIARAYVDHYAEADKLSFEVLGVEELQVGPISNPTTGKQFSDYIAAGKIDVRLYQRERKRRSIMDHKILASRMEDHHHEHLLVDTQPLQYALLEHMNGERIDSAIWDVVAKTEHRPKAGETLPEFEERVYELYVQDPHAFFARKEVPITEYNLAQYAMDLYSWTRMLESARQSGQHLKTPESCFDYRRPCRYLPICSGRVDLLDGLQSGQLVKIQERHPELELDASIDETYVITNSRLKVFRQCMYKHDLQYNLGIRRSSEVAEEPLFVGSAMHKALEAYWLALKQCAA